MNELPTLYDHQAEHRDRLRASLARNRSVIAQAPPGCGKTRLAKWIMGAAANNTPKDNQSGKALFAVHRRGLVDNASNSFAEEPALDHGIIMSGREHAIHHRIQVASIDSLLSWFCEGGQYTWKETFDLVVFDETHSHFTKLGKFLAAHNPKRESLGLSETYVVGLSATPETKGLDDIYNDIVSGPTTEWLIDNGFLSPFRYFRATQGQLDKLKRRGGEFTKDSVCSAMDGLAGDLVRDWKNLADGRATVGFFPRLSQAREAQELLRSAGIDAQYVDGKTPDDERRQLFAHLNEGRIDYLCNVGVIERGTDIPRVGCVQLCTAIGSKVRYLQMIGRGSRTHDAKSDCIVLDHGGNVKRHGLFEDPHEWTLDYTSKDCGEQGTKPTIECPRCTAIYRGGMCRQCGYEPTPRERKSQGLEFDGSELKEYKRSDQKDTKKPTCNDLIVSALYRAGRSGRTWRQAVGIAKSMGAKKGVVFRVPSKIEVGGRTLNSIKYGDPEGYRRVSALFDGMFS